MDPNATPTNLTELLQFLWVGLFGALAFMAPKIIQWIPWLKDRSDKAEASEAASTQVLVTGAAIADRTAMQILAESNDRLTKSIDRIGDLMLAHLKLEQDQDEKERREVEIDREVNRRLRENMGGVSIDDLVERLRGIEHRR